MLSRSIVGGLAVLLLLFAPSPAWPCGVLPVCSPTRVVPAGGVPANVSEVFLEYGQSCAVPPAATTADDAVLETAAGVPVSFTRIDNRLVPDAGLAEGTRYQVRFTETCPADAVCPWDDTSTTGGWTEGPPRELAVEFEALPAAPPPGSLGTVRIASQTFEILDVWSSDGRCTTPVRANVVVLAIEPSSDLAPWSSMTRFTVWVDGEPRASTAYGTTGRASFGVATSWNGGAGGARLFWTLCQDEVVGQDGSVQTPGLDFDAGLEPGVHQVRVDAYVASHDLVLSETLEIELGCGKKFERGENPTGPVSGCSYASGDGGFALSFILGGWLLAWFRRRPG